MREYTDADKKCLQECGNEMHSILQYKLDRIKGLVKEAETRLSYNAFASALDELDKIEKTASGLDAGTRRLIEATRPRTSS